MLHVPVGANTFSKTEASATGRPAATWGTSITPAVGSKGSWAQVIASTGDASFGILVNINSASTSNASRNYTVDIGVGAGGSETVLIADLLGGNAGTYSVGPGWYYFPIFIPAGTRIAARAQGSVTTAFSVLVWLYERPINASQIRKGSFCETLGISGAEGVVVVPGTTSEGSWTSLGTTAKKLWWRQVGFQVRSSDTSHAGNAIHVDLAVGNGTTFDVIIADTLFITTSAEVTQNLPLTVGVEWPVPAGSTIYVRAQNSAGLDAYTMAAYGMGG